MEQMDDFYNLTIWKTDVEDSLGIKLTKEQFDEVIMESKNTFIDEIRRDLSLMKKDLLHIWTNPNQLTMEI
tara:strand:- start:16 stop:228 length:213 start_codon:yes stop_codon:yes gene_type:complete